MQLVGGLHLHVDINHGVIGGVVRVAHDNRDGVITFMHIQPRVHGNGAVLCDGCPVRRVVAEGELRSLSNILRSCHGLGIQLLDGHVVVLRLVDLVVRLLGDFHLQLGLVGGFIRVVDDDRHGVVARGNLQVGVDGDGAVLCDGRPGRYSLTGGELRAVGDILRSRSVFLIPLLHLDVGVLRVVNLVSRLGLNVNLQRCVADGLVGKGHLDRNGVLARLHIHAGLDGNRAVSLDGRPGRRAFASSERGTFSSVGWLSGGFLLVLHHRHIRVLRGVQFVLRLDGDLHLHDGIVGGGIGVGDNDRDGVVARLHVQARIYGDGAVLTDGGPLRSVGTLGVGGTFRCLRSVLRGNGILLLHLNGVVLGLIEVGSFSNLSNTQRLVLTGSTSNPEANSAPQSPLTVEHIVVIHTPLRIIFQKLGRGLNLKLACLLRL